LPLGPGHRGQRATRRAPRAGSGWRDLRPGHRWADAAAGRAVEGKPRGLADVERRGSRLVPRGRLAQAGLRRACRV